MCEKNDQEITKSVTLPKAGISATFVIIGGRVALLELLVAGHSLPFGMTCA